MGNTDKATEAGKAILAKLEALEESFMAHHERITTLEESFTKLVDVVANLATGMTAVPPQMPDAATPAKAKRTKAEQKRLDGEKARRASNLETWGMFDPHFGCFECGFATYNPDPATKHSLKDGHECVELASTGQAALVA